MENQVEETKIELSVYSSVDRVTHTRLFTINEIKQRYDQLVIDINNHKENEVVNEDFQIRNIITLKWDRYSIILSLKEANNLRTLLETYLSK
jgi:Zn-dependent peptidase ImmA (M78 family)